MGILHHHPGNSQAQNPPERPLFKPGKTETRRGPGSSEITHLVEGPVGAPTLGLHHHIGVQEVGRNHVRHKRCVLILEDHSHDVIANVSLPLQLNTEPQPFSAWQGAQGARGGCPLGWRGAGGRQRAHLGSCFPPENCGEKLVLKFCFLGIP